jgi:DNA-binding IclR family transcriptional regulator
MSTDDVSSIHKTTEAAIDLLDYIRRSNGATVAEMVEKFDLSRSTVYIHLNTLSQNGYLVREHGQYYIGLRFRELSVCAQNRRPSYQIIRKRMEALDTETEGEVEFLVEESGRINLVYHSENVRHDRVRLHPHNTAAGKAILAELPTERVEAILDRWGLPEETPNTITNRRDLFKELETIAEQGYAFNDRECFEGYHGIGAAIEGIDGSIIGAITIGGPVYRVDKHTLETELTGVLRDTVEDIEATFEDQRESIIRELSNQ